MFILVLIKDTLRIPTEDATLLQKDILQRLRFELSDKYVNEILPDLGMCILVHSIIAYDEPQLFQGDPNPYIRCTFRLVVWQPVDDEIMIGTIVSSDASKIVLSVDFFNNIHIEGRHLPPGSSYDEEEKLWVWNNDGNQYYFDIGMISRFKVSSTVFSTKTIEGEKDVQPKLTTIPSREKARQHGYLSSPDDLLALQQSAAAVSKEPAAANASPGASADVAYAIPLTVFGDMSQPGLGPIEWWD